MVAAVETYGNLAAFASLRVPAWHGLGNVFGKPVTTEQMLDLSHLGRWNLRLVDAVEFTGHPFAKPTQFVVRDNPFTGAVEVLGTVGGRYEILSNEEALNFGDQFSKNRRWETAGSIENGTRVFATLAEADDIVLDPKGQNDTVKRYTLITTAHDGSGLVVIKRVHMRVVCKNTLGIALREAGDEVKVRHTKTMRDRMVAGAKALGFLQANNDAFEAAAQKMIAKSATDADFWRIVDGIFPKPEKDVKGAVKKWENKRDSIGDVWNGTTSSMNDLDKTAWRVFNTLTEHGQWFRQTRNGDTPAGRENWFAAGADFDASAKAFRQDVFDRTMAFVGA